MSLLWPHPPYAEDQPHHTAILTTHVLLRGFQTGAVIGPLVGTARYFLHRRRSPPLLPAPRYLPTILRTTGTSSIVGTAILALALVGRMWEREEIEWKDRAWRLLENKGQVEVDTWSVGGMVAGGAAAAVGGAGRGVRGVVGGVGLGGTVGVLGYMVWRHGVKGGKWDV